MYTEKDIPYCYHSGGESSEETKSHHLFERLLQELLTLQHINIIEVAESNVLLCAVRPQTTILPFSHFHKITLIVLWVVLHVNVCSLCNISNETMNTLQWGVTLTVYNLPPTYFGHCLALINEYQLIANSSRNCVYNVACDFTATASYD